MNRKNVALILLLAGLFWLPGCNVEDAGANKKQLQARQLPTGVGGEILNELAAKMDAAGFSQAQSQNVLDGASVTLYGEGLSASEDVGAVAPVVMRGAQVSLAETDSGIETAEQRLSAISVILESVVKSASLRVGSLANQVGPRFALSASFEAVITNIVIASTGAMDDSGVQVDVMGDSMGTVMSGLFASLPGLGIADADMSAFSNALVAGAVSALDESGLATANLSSAIDKVITSSVAGLQRSGMSNAMVLSTTGGVAGGAISGLKLAGVSDNDLSTFVSNAVSSSLGGLAAIGMSTAEISGAAETVADKAIHGMQAAGYSSTLIESLSTPVRNGVDQGLTKAGFSNAQKSTVAGRVDTVTRTAVSSVSQGAVTLASSGFVITKISGRTSEDGATAYFFVSLSSKPDADVVIPVSSSNQLEGTVSPTSLKFTAANWKARQKITVTGVNDDLQDGKTAYNVILGAATSTDALYNSKNPADVPVVNLDNDTGGFIVTLPSGATSEAKTKATFTVRLQSKPTADVLIQVNSSNTAEGTVFPSSLTFTTLSWASPQTITVTGVDDDFKDGDKSYFAELAPAASTDPVYSGMDPVDRRVLNKDNDSSGLTVGAITAHTSEAGSSASFTLKMASRPLTKVTIPVSVDDATEGKLLITNVIFTPANWNKTETVTVSGVNDDAQDGAQTYHVVLGAAVSDDADYSGINLTDVTVINDDNDTAGITVSPISGNTNESGGTTGSATFTVKLNTKPTRNVTMAISSSDTTEATVSPATLTFTPTDWNASSHVVTAAGVDDLVMDGDKPFTITLANAQGDAAYANKFGTTVTAKNVDNDTAGFTVSAVSGTTSESKATATFTVRLNSKPSQDVFISVAPQDTTEAKVDKSSLTFTSSAYADQTVTVTGVDDDLIDGNQVSLIRLTPGSTDANYSALGAKDVSVTNRDNDSAAFVIRNSSLATLTTSLSTTEAGGQATFSVALASKPTANVVISLSCSDATEGSIDKTTLTFTPVNWKGVQVVTVTGVNDDIIDGNQVYSVILGVSQSVDPKYNGVKPQDVGVINTDNETAGITFSKAEVVTAERGLNDSFTVVLNSQPFGNVTVPISITTPSPDSAEASVSPASLTYTIYDWNAPKTVTVTGLRGTNLLRDANQPYTVVFGAMTSNDLKYSALNPPDLPGTNIDMDSPGVVYTKISGNTSETNLGSATFSAVLNNPPTTGNTVVMNLTSSDTTEATVSPAQFTFTAANALSPKVFTVTGVVDNIMDGNQPFTISTTLVSGDTGYNGKFPTSQSATNTDKDTAGFVVSAVTGQATEAGGTATFTVKLTSAPITGNVVLDVTSSNTAEATVSPAQLTFTNQNWGAPQTVTITGVDDSIDDGNQLFNVVLNTNPSTVDYSAQVGTGYKVLNPPDVNSLTNTDNDTAGITVTQVSNTTTELGGTASFKVRLNSQPLANVQIPISSLDTTEGTVNLSTNNQRVLTFTPGTGGNWGTDQTVVIKGVDDLMADGNKVYSAKIAAAISADAKYNLINPADVSLTNTDNDTAGYIRTNSTLVTSESGVSSTFTIKLNSQPSGNVVIDFAVTDTTEARLSHSRQTFGTTNWATVRTIKVTGLDDTLNDGNQPFNVTSTYNTTLSSDTTGYSSLNGLGALSYLNKDNETGISAFNFNKSLNPGLQASRIGQFWANNEIHLWVEGVHMVTALKPSISGFGTISPASGVAQNFTNPVTYTATAADGTVKTYKVIVHRFRLVPDTGYLNCFNELGVQRTCPAPNDQVNGSEDVSYTHNALSYTAYADGTVRDNVTGLVWARAVHTNGRQSWANAGKLCNSMVYGGRSNWRLPNPVELMSLRRGGTGLLSGRMVDKVFTSWRNLFHWTDKAFEGTQHVGVTFVDPNQTYNHRVGGGTTHYRCVSGDNIPISLQDMGDGTVLDHSTRLRWQQGENKATTWMGALVGCEGLTLAGATDWRLPNYKELFSANWYHGNTNLPTFHRYLFPSSSTGMAYWSSSTTHGVAQNATALYKNDLLQYPKTKALNYRCVRGGK